MVAIGESIRVLVVEDEESYRQALSVGLRREGFEVDVAADGTEGLTLFADRTPDIVLLDMLLPGMHGMEVCRRMRMIAPVPIVMVERGRCRSRCRPRTGTGGGGLRDQTVPPARAGRPHAGHPAAHLATGRSALPPHAATEGDSGPDRAVAAGLQHADHHSDQHAAAFGAVQVDFVRREVTVAGVQTHLSRREFDLLAVLLSPPRRVRTRDELIDLLWPDRYLSDSRTLDTHIHRLRAKLEPEPTEPRFIVTVRGVGFRIDPDGTHPMPSVLSPSADQTQAIPA